MQTEHNTDNKSKVIIGQYYQAPLKNHMTAESEFWQSVYLGEYQRDVVYKLQMSLYVVFLIILFTTLAVFI
jgi:hypothetical protein